MINLKDNNQLNKLQHKEINYLANDTVTMCSFCQNCDNCEKFMIVALKHISQKYRNNTNDALMSLNFIAGLGGEDTKDLNNLIFQRYCSALILLDDNIGISEDDNTLFFHDTGIFKLISLSENCVYKVIRISPFSNKKQTSLTAVRAEKEDFGTDNINTNEIEFQYTKSSGAGGQHVNKTMSCVVATHTKTGIRVRISQERSQHQNKNMAVKLLLQKIKNMKQVQKDNKNKQEYKAQYKISWGGGFDRIINLHKNKFLKVKSNTNSYSLNSISDMPLLRVIFDNIITFI